MRLDRPTIVLATVLATACVSGSDAEPGSLLAEINDSERLTIGIRFDQPGLSERTIDGRFVGFDVDVATYLAGELGVERPGITWRETTSATREDDLTSGRVDLVVAAYSITEDRKEKVTFAGPYFETGQDLLVRHPSAGITGPDTLNGRKLCSVTGSTSAQQVRDRFARAVELVEYPRYRDCVTALLAGQVDAVTTDAVILAGYAAEHPELLEVVGKRFSTERYGVGLRKGDTGARSAVNEAIEKMIGTGAWLDSLEHNIGPSGYRLPDPPELTER
ncbi:glutamate ABC transporter substrate-binding protein [Amycolatopsis cihanbeyliensis]|uniref:Amino acid ABC transporter substrate-binding protein (PAAT family) n=1 Tax=Amycolatopsis cihanbeyliensis TaxID=1128664 RepID=A0A542DQ21_AMYCI|nr:glutamate ABC transporter substrate-binding protein [Amycolatopsis cihanbeyliensis]TQJ05192.1 amino acid ABC transporter substrate-binding protein (PAAT family) [Amycolatopsis cihanbeyliensis]